ncbi:Flagellar biosynthetic protein FliQ [Buchnera aphidicola (Eriosoma grossulariae)]|uniref:flagellar biosynthesis protein FliQ n=1 Tax=Buchnera aphidicola TaxID=9 RepID=UPI00346496D3
MTPELVMTMFHEAIKVSLLLSFPLLLSALITGLVISLLQASTQINEQTLSFIPKIISVFSSIVFFGPWMLNVLIDYVQNLFNNLPLIIH